MKPIDRMYATLYHEEPDMVPDGRDIRSAGYAITRGYDRLPCALIKEGPGFHVWKSPFGSVHLDVRQASTLLRTDDLSNRWKESASWWYTLAPAIRWPEDLERVERPRLDPDRLKSAKKRVEEFHREGYFVVNYHAGVFDAPWRYLRGLKQWLIDIVRDPGFARKIIEFAAKSQMEIANAVIEETGVDAIYIIGDLGTPQGPFISPTQYRELIYPWHRRLAESYHKRGAFFFVHSHGNLMQIMDDMVRAGFDAINPISPLCRMSLAEMKEKYGDKITLHADLSIEMGSEKKIDTLRYTRMFYGLEPNIDALEYTIRTAAPGGGFIFTGVSSRYTGIAESYYEQRRLRRKLTEQQIQFVKAWDRLRRYPISA